MTKKDTAALLGCYMLWGFQPLYWGLIGDVGTMTVMPLRIVFAALFSVLILALQKRTGELKALFKDRKMMKFLLPAALFLLADWTVYIILVNSGHIIDVSLGYYINPLLLFLIGALIYREKCGAGHFIALAVAVMGVVVSAAAFGSVPYTSLIIAVNWAVYAAIKKNVSVDGVLSIAAETLILTIPALIFMLLFRRAELAQIPASSWLPLLGSGVVTALPMFLYSRCVSRLPLVLMCFAQYLSPTFGLVCAFIKGESFSQSQLISLAFFIAAIVIFTVSELKRQTMIKEK
ncbi:MAG: EamA family transporter RarD [Oscillospiraceae bacterium]